MELDLAPAPMGDDGGLLIVDQDLTRDAAEPLFKEFGSEWLLLDCELLPWSAKAGELIRSQYAGVGAAAPAR